MQNRNSFQTEESRSYQTSEPSWSHSPVRVLYSSIPTQAIPAKQGKTLLFEVKIGSITYMEKDEIKFIVDYVKDLEEGLVEWDYDHIAICHAS